MNIITPNSTHTYANDDRVAHAPGSNTGEHPVGNISVVPPSSVEAKCPAHPTLQEMPDEILLNIFSRLSFRENVVVKSTCKAADRVVNDLLSTQSKCWFSRFSPQLQAIFRKIAEGTDEQMLRTWLGQFTKDEKMVKHLIDNRQHPHYPELLFYTVSWLMADCHAFKIEQVASIEHTNFVIATTFSDDGNHMVTRSFGGQSKICSLSPGGNWIEKTTIYDENRSFLSWARFSGDGKHLKIGYPNSPAKIYALNTDGNWVSEKNLPQGSQINFTEFSPDGLHVAIIDKTNTLSIFGQGMDGAWAEEKKGEIPDRVYLSPPIFNHDSNELVAVSANEELLIYRCGSDGRWTEQAILPNIKAISSVFQASPNDRHRVSQYKLAKSSKIFGCSTDGDWMEQAVIDHKASSAEFSPNNRYLVINCYDTATIYYLDMNEGRLEKGSIDSDSISGLGRDGDWLGQSMIDRKDWVSSVGFSPISRFLVMNCHNVSVIYYLDMNGSWIEKTTLDSTSIPANAAISFDGRFLVISANNDTVKLYRLGPDGQCIETASIDNATHAFFSTDSNHIATFHQHNDVDGNVRLYALSRGGKLKLKATFAHGQPICSATISPTGRYLATNGHDGKSKIWILCSSAENEPDARESIRE